MIEKEYLQLQLRGVKIERIKEFSILCLPDNINTNEECLYESEDILSVYKNLKNQGVKCAISDDLGISSGRLERRSDEIWLGVYWILNSIALPIFIDIIQTRLKGMLKNKQFLGVEITGNNQSKVHLDMSIKKGDDLSKLSYSGDPKTLLNILKSLKIDSTIE